jgi:hypothetical protein
MIQELSIAPEAGYGTEELFQRFTLCPQPPHLVADGTYRRRTGGVGAVEGKVGLINLANQVTIGYE